MPVPAGQAWAVVRWVGWNRWRGRHRYPLVLMLEPLLRCNLACPGCGKIRHSADVLRRQLTCQQCWDAADECAAPIVSIAGGEPLLHPEIGQLVRGLLARKKYLYLCTNALKLSDMLSEFPRSRRLAFSVHLDGPAVEHDRAVGRRGVYETAVQAIRAARTAGFRVTTNTTVFRDSDPQSLREHFDTLMQLGVEGMMISPAYSYAAADQQHFLRREETQELFRAILGQAKRGWRFNQTPLFLAFLRGDWELDCTAWGNPAYNVFGWQRPCYLLAEGSCASYQQLLDQTDWSQYGPASGNPRCRDCMVHCGFEPSAVAQTLGTWQGLWATLRLSL